MGKEEVGAGRTAKAGGGGVGAESVVGVESIVDGGGGSGGFDGGDVG